MWRWRSSTAYRSPSVRHHRGRIPPAGGLPAVTWLSEAWLTVDGLSILLISDTHIGFDYPLKPRRLRRLRGPDFLRNMQRALRLAQRRQVDLVIHGGDLFFRTRINPALIDIAMMPLISVAESGIPVFLVPGNHEGGRIPQGLWSRHPRLHIFSSPRTFFIRTRFGKLALAGFPFVRNVRSHFNHRLADTGWDGQASDLRLLCMHQAVEGARSGPSGFIFRSGEDVLPGNALPAAFACVASGHMHQAQVIRRDPKGRPLASPVIYPGSIERTSFAERAEHKGCMILHFGSRGAGDPAGPEVEWNPLPSRPMVSLDLNASGCSGGMLRERVFRSLQMIDPEAIVRLQVRHAAPQALAALTAACLRSLAPPSMNVELIHPRQGCSRE
jgi:DNA repair exonuclease SbcCD nuclease subunit